jgi:hypothetical protein
VTRVARFFLIHDTKTGKNVPNEHKKYQILIKHPNVHKIYQMPPNISTLSHLRPSKISPNWDFWFEKKPPGNPASDQRAVFNGVFT